MMKRFVLFLIFATASLGLSAQDVADSCAMADTIVVAPVEADIRSGMPGYLELVSKEKRYRRQCKWFKFGGWFMLGASALYLPGCYFVYKLGEGIGGGPGMGKSGSMWKDMDNGVILIPTCSALAVSAACFIGFYISKHKWKQTKAQLSLEPLVSMLYVGDAKPAPSLGLRITF